MSAPPVWPSDDPAEIAAFLGSLFDASPLGFAVVDREGRYVHANGVLAAWHGTRPEEITGSDPAEVVPGIAGLTERLREIMDSGEALVDARASGPTTGNEGVRHFRASYLPIRGASGDVVGLAVIARDITTGIRASDQLGQLARRLSSQQQLLQTLVDLVPVGIALTRGPAHEYVLANSAALATAPVEGPLRGRTVADVFAGSPETVELGRQIYDRVFTTGDPLTLNGLALPAPGQAAAFEGHRYYDVTFTRMDAGEGELGVLGVYVEVTDTVRRRVRLERELADEHQVALELQASLVPRALPQIPGLALSAVLRPAGPRTLVGGDFYDVIRWHDDRWLVVLGDVCGKGVAAARVTALVRHAIRGAAMVQDDIVDLMGTINRVLLDDHVPGSTTSMSTLALVALEVGPASTAMEIALAGHPPPVVLGGGGPAAYVGAPGTMLGASAQPVFTCTHATLEAGQTLLLYSDGLPDAHAPARFIEPVEMAASHAALAGDPASLVGAMRDDVVSGEGEPRDDLALLAVCHAAAPVREIPAAA